MAYFSVVEGLAKQWLAVVQGKAGPAVLAQNEALDAWTVVAPDGMYWEVGATLDEAEALLRAELVEHVERKAPHVQPAKKTPKARKEQAVDSVRYITVAEIAEETGLRPATVSNYLSGRSEPALRVARRRQVRGAMQALILRSDYEVWKAAYSAKPPFGSNLHKDRR